PCTEGITFADPLLEPLDDNGGFTPTATLPAGSPAVDFTTDCSPEDQRGETRQGECDSGAYEYVGAL
ncbi:hypothetical protein KJ865_01305, partial [Myxococcota bacterium]|nr:hypothetical protein [Myxococcota bacterium]